MLTMKLANNIPYILAVVGLYVAFVSLYFFTIGQSIEKDVVSTNITRLGTDMKNHIDLIDNIGGSTVSDTIKSQLTYAKKNAPDLSSADAKVKISNAKVKADAERYISIIFLTTLTVSMIYALYGMDMKVVDYFKTVFGPAILLVIMVAVLEITFFMTITRSYMTVSPADMYIDLFSNLKKEFQ